MKKLLGTLDICGVDYKVFEGATEDNEELEGNHGVCSSSKQEIWIKAGLSTARFRDTLMHEIFHGMMEESGAGNATGAIFGVTDENDPIIARWEETFIRVVTPHLLRVFGLPRLTLPRKAKP